MIDYLIVGQGLAGTFLHYELSKLGLNCVIIDQLNPKSASQVAAGLINPITGKRLVKSWLFDEAFQYFLKTINELEQLFNTQYFFQNDIIKPLKSIEEENNWSAKSQDPTYAEFIEVKNKTDFQNFGDCYSFGLIKKGGYLNIKKLLSDYKLFINNDNKFINEYFDYSQINFTLGEVAYKNFIAKG
nr:FAD-binding oxidoreductase [Saprospiraceae bacterium]